MTPLQIREKLIELASRHIPKAKVGDLKELLKLKGTPNGGIAVTDDLKYNSKRLPQLHRSYPMFTPALQSNIRAQIASMYLLQPFGMDWWLEMSPALLGRKSG